MIPFLSFSWDSGKRWVSLKWNGFLSLVWEKGRVMMKILGFAIPFRPGQKKSRLPLRWVYLKEAFSFLVQWKLKKVEGTISLPDPMMNGLLYGWVSALEAVRPGPKIRVEVNFQGENQLSGEATLSPRAFFYSFRRWILLFLKERKIRRLR